MELWRAAPSVVDGIARPAPSVTRSRKILLAEDNRVNHKLTTALLGKLGHQVTVVATGAEVLEFFRPSSFGQSSFDVVLMDVQLPEMDGLQATRAIRAVEAIAGAGRVPVIALTANAMKGDREQCLEAGMDNCLAKPFSADDLKHVLARGTVRECQSRW